MGLLDKWKDVLGLGKKKESNKEEKKETKKQSKVLKKEIIKQVENKSIINTHPIDNNISSNRKQRRRVLLDEAKNGQN